MGVLTEHVASKFFLAKSDEKAALAALKEGVRYRELSEDYVHNPEVVLAAKDFVSAMRATAFVLERNQKGDITSLRWAGDKLPYDTDELQNLFSTFVPWVKKGSFLSIREEDVPCTLTFAGTRVKRKMHGEKDDEGREAFENGRRHAENGRFDLALTCYAAAWAIDGKKRDSYGQRAVGHACELLFEKKRWKELAQWCARYLPKEERPFGSYAESAEDPKAARLLIAAGLKVNPRDVRCLQWLIEDHQRRDEFEKVIAAARALRAASKTEAPSALLSEANALYSLARYRDALKAAQASMKLAPERQAAVLIADCFLALGMKKEALAAFRQGLAYQQKRTKKTDWGPSLAYEALLLLRLERLDETAATLDRAAAAARQDSPQFWVPYVRGQLAMARKDFAAALPLFETALAASPTDPWPKLRLFQALHALGAEPARAKKLANELKKNCPDLAREVRETIEAPVMPEVRSLKLDFEKHFNDHEFQKVIVVARKLRKAEPDSRERWMSTEAAMLYRLGRYKESLTLTRQCFKLRPSVNSALRIADALLALGRPKEVPELLERALELQKETARKGKWPPDHAIVARILVRLGRLDEAEKILKRAARYPAERPEFWLPFVRGELAMAKEDFAAALVDFEKALVANPNEAWPKLRVAQALAALGRDRQRVKKLSAEIKKDSPDLARELSR